MTGLFLLIQGKLHHPECLRPTPDSYGFYVAEIEDKEPESTFEKVQHCKKLSSNKHKTTTSKN
jgi:hypothetical protein